MSDFEITEFEIGNGLLGLGQCPGMTGAYGQDLYVVQDWRPSFVLSLLSHEEMAQNGAARFSLDVPTLGARWLYFPIDPGGSPHPSDAKVWSDVSSKICATLKGGGRVLVHSRNGFGRGGMVTLRLMVEMGEPVMAGLARLRYLRHRAVETDAQYDWAAEGADQQFDQG